VDRSYSGSTANSHHGQTAGSVDRCIRVGRSAVDVPQFGSAHGKGRGCCSAHRSGKPSVTNTSVLGLFIL